jgi:branched-subunit amino acid transport protein AzlD
VVWVWGGGCRDYTITVKSSLNLFYHQQTNIHDFIPIFVFVTVSVSDFVKKFVTSISYQIFCLLGTFCFLNLQILNYNQLGHYAGIVGTCLGHIWYPQILKRERNPYISIKLLLNSKRRIFWKFSFMLRQTRRKRHIITPQNVFFFLGGGVMIVEYFHEFLGLGHKTNFWKTLGQSRCFGIIIG